MSRFEYTGTHQAPETNGTGRTSPDTDGNASTGHDKDGAEARGRARCSAASAKAAASPPSRWNTAYRA